jgi:DNA-binding MarR family transcriptional regulator
MRMIRMVKRPHATGIEPALQYLLYTVNCAGPLRLSDLASQVQLDVSTVSRHVRALEEAGCLERATDPGDRRAAFLSLTASGRKVLDDTFARRRAALDAALAGWSSDDLGTLERLLNKLADDLESAAAANPTVTPTPTP